MKSLTERLKEATRDRHARLEALPFVAALSCGTLPGNSYLAHLRSLTVIHAAFEQALRHASHPVLADLREGRPSRLAHLRADLSILDNHREPDCLAAAGWALQAAARIRSAGGEPEALLGYYYVLEGMTLGNEVHLPDVQRSLGYRAAGGDTYFRGYGERTATFWQETCTAVNLFAGSGTGEDRIMAAAIELFDLFERLFASLYPVPPDGWGYTAVMLNPEAGAHPVPQCGAELEAALSAADRCRDEFPYFEERYRQRGRAFARSDAAWLAAMGSLAPEQLLAQVEWLGRVLSNRGMPRLTLERQLCLLHEELVKRHPERSSVATGLLDAACQLQAERCSQIPQERCHEIAARFRAATDDEMQGRFSGTGQLIVAAICDEAAGIVFAGESLETWLTDPERFPESWCHAVSASFAAARAAVTGN